MISRTCASSCSFASPILEEMSIAPVALILMVIRCAEPRIAEPVPAHNLSAFGNSASKASPCQGTTSADRPSARPREYRFWAHGSALVDRWTWGIIGNHFASALVPSVCSLLLPEAAGDGLQARAPSRPDASGIQRGAPSRPDASGIQRGAPSRTDLTRRAPADNESLLREVGGLPYAFGLQQMAALVLRDD